MRRVPDVVTVGGIAERAAHTKLAQGHAHAVVALVERSALVAVGAGGSLNAAQRAEVAGLAPSLRDGGDAAPNVRVAVAERAHVAGITGRVGKTEQRVEPATAGAACSTGRAARTALASLPRRRSRSGPAARSRRSTSACRRAGSRLTALRAPTDTCRPPGAAGSSRAGRSSRATIAGRAVARRAIQGSVAPSVREGPRRAFLTRGTRPEAHCATEHKAQAKSWEHVSHAPQSTPRVAPGKGRPACPAGQFSTGITQHVTVSVTPSTCRILSSTSLPS